MHDINNINRETFEDIYHRYGSELRNYAIKLTGNEHAAEDIVQQTLMRLVTYEGTIRQIRSFLYKIATDFANDWERDRIKRRAMSIDTKPDHIGGYDHTDGNVQQVEETACKNEDIKRLLNNIERLSPVEQAAIKAIFFGDLGYEKAAEQLNMQIGTLWSHVSRAKDKLRKMMESTE